MSQPRRNVELKAVDRDPAATLRAAFAAGAQDRGLLRQRDTYFRVAHGRLKLREQEPGGAQLVAYARPDDPAVRVSDYHLIEVADAEAARSGLSAACGVRVVVDKRRRLLMWENVRIHLDEVDGLGAFVELEAVVAADGDLDAEHAKIARLRAALGIGDDALCRGSYADALAPPADAALVEMARAAAANAYAPYSRLRVGAAVRTADGRRYAGANVENAAYPQGSCAEQSAIAAMVAAGGGRIAEVVVSAAHAVAPCGGCRQRLAEFAGPEAMVHLADGERVTRTLTLGELLPATFDRGDLP